MSRRTGKRKLARLILAALMSTGGGLAWSPSVEATANVFEYENTSPITIDASNVNVNTNLATMNENDYVFGNFKFTVKNGYMVMPNIYVLSPSAEWKTVESTTINVRSGIIMSEDNDHPASNCSVTMTGGALNHLYGAYGGTKNAENNKVTVSGGKVSELYGGYSLAGAANGNAVEISDANVSNLNGGYGKTGADGNTLTVNNSTLWIAKGGSSADGPATNNTVKIGGSGTNFSGDEDYRQVVGGFSNTGAVSGNTVEISGGEISCPSWGVIGGWSNENAASDNTVTISGGTVSGDIYGGYAAVGNATKNEVTISGGTVGNAAGWGGINGGYSGTGAADGNTVEITGGTINNDIWGGHSEGASASGNTVTISGNTVFQSTKGIHGGAAAAGAASDNIVNILSPIEVAYLIGGEGATSSGNTLNLAAVGVTTAALGSFQNLNFYLPSGVASGDTMLTVNGGAATDLTGVTFGVAALSGVSLAKNDTVNLITNPNGLTTDATLKTADSASLGTAEFLTANNLATDTKYTLGISKSGDNTIIATVENVTEESGGGSGGGTTITAEDRLKSPVETRAAAVTLLNAGADMLASQGFAQAANAVALEAAEQAKSAEPGAAAPVASTFTPFAAFGGSSMRAESGSHVDTKGFGINVGFAKEFANSQGKLLFGPVVEYGGGTYDSYNNDIHGDGNSHYWGVGVMARQVNHDGFYYEGSVRGGRVTSDYGANYPVGRVSYDSSSNYWAAHLGLGKVFAAGAKGTVDGYLKYFYSHQSGDDVTLNGAGERASFDSVDSNRIRIGARYTHKVNEMNSFYGGLAYQYEFGGEARAHYAGLGEAPSPSVKGSSGMLELGWQVKPNNGPVTIDLGVTGWAGKQRGGSVQLGATWTF